MKTQIIALIISTALLSSCSADTNNIEVAQTSEGHTVGAFYPPTDRALVYYSEFEIFIPASAKFESYGDYDDLKSSWLTINSSDRQLFIDSNDIKTGAVDSKGRLTYSAPIKNKSFPSEQWTVDYVVGSGSDETTYIRIEIRLKSKPNRDTQNKDFLADASKWVKSGSKINVVE